MNLKLTSLQNPRVKQVVQLRERRERQRARLLLVEGEAELRLALASGARATAIYFCPELGAQPERLPLPPDTELIEVTEGVFAKMAYRDGPDGWLGVFAHAPRTLESLNLPPNPLLLITEAVEKPGNLGAMLRTADAAGVDAVIVCDPTTDVTNPNVVRASKGTLFTVPVVETTSAAAWAWLKACNIALIAATPQATQLYTATDLRGPVAIAVGTEKEGLSQTWLAQTANQVFIPMVGQVNSLNVATAAALLVYEAVRQREE